MYVAAPFLLARLARFEGHLTLAGRQAANFVKLLVFFLVNLFLFKVGRQVLSCGDRLRKGRRGEGGGIGDWGIGRGFEDGMRSGYRNGGGILG